MNVKYFFAGVAMLVLAGGLKADELDREYKDNKAATKQVQAGQSALFKIAATELDQESPTQAHRWGGGYGCGYRGCGWGGGCGWRGCYGGGYGGGYGGYGRYGCGYGVSVCYRPSCYTPSCGWGGGCYRGGCYY
jgi:hypothetical protein